MRKKTSTINGFLGSLSVFFQERLEYKEIKKSHSIIETVGRETVHNGSFGREVVDEYLLQ